MIHLGLDLVGMTEIPIISQVGDITNAGLYIVEGDPLNAGLSLAGVALVGVTAVRYGARGARLLDNADLVLPPLPGATKSVPMPDGRLLVTTKIDGVTTRHIVDGAGNVSTIPAGGVDFGGGFRLGTDGRFYNGNRFAADPPGVVRYDPNAPLRIAGDPEAGYYAITNPNAKGVYGETVVRETLKANNRVIAGEQVHLSVRLSDGSAVTVYPDFLVREADGSPLSQECGVSRTCRDGFGQRRRRWRVSH